MHFKLGKPKEKSEREKIDIALKDITSERIEKMEKRIYGRTKDLEEKTQQIQGLTDRSGDVPLGPHGPIGELTLDTVEPTNLAELRAMSESDDEEGGVKVKLVEVSAVSAPPPIKAAQVKLAEAKAALQKPPAIGSETKKESPKDAKPEVKAETKPEVKPEENGDSLGKLFNQNEEEANPLANLINSLPDVTTQELIDDIKEIKHIIKEWQVK